MSRFMETCSKKDLVDLVQARRACKSGVFAMVQVNWKVRIGVMMVVTARI